MKYRDREIWISNYCILDKKKANEIKDEISARCRTWFKYIKALITEDDEVIKIEEIEIFKDLVKNGKDLLINLKKKAYFNWNLKKMDHFVLLNFSP